MKYIYVVLGWDTYYPQGDTGDWMGVYPDKISALRGPLSMSPRREHYAIVKIDLDTMEHRTIWEAP